MLGNVCSMAIHLGLKPFNADSFFLADISILNRDICILNTGISTLIDKCCCCF